MVVGRGVRVQYFVKSLMLLGMLLCFASSAILTEGLCSTAGPKVDCGFVGIDEAGCTDKGCCWSPGQAGTAAHQNEAWCFYSNDDISEYELVTTKDTDVGWEGLLRNLTSTQSELGPDITSLTVKADTSQSDILHITITDLHDERWHVPPSLFPESSFAAGYVSQKKPEAAAYDLSYASTPFSFAVTRAGVENDTAIFSTTGQRFMFKEQYIEVNSAIEANSSLFGLEEHTASGGLRLQRAGRPLAMWNHDTLSANADTNLYGSHPFVLEVRPDGSSHGILMLNSNAMEVGVTEDTLSWRMTGGVIDVHVLMGPTPSQVLQQLTAIIGRPALPPLWSLGFHQCKWGYKHVEELADVVAKYKAADIPLEVMWTDIDYMDGYRDFSLDPNNFSKDKMQAFVKQLHSSKQYWVPIVDPGIKVDPGYPAYDQGLAAKAFINDFTGKPYLGQVWPGATHFPDFLSKAGVKYWGEQLQAFHQLAAFDGLWIDMNEASNFCTGDVCHMPTQGATPNASAWLTTTSYTGSSNACQLTCDTPEDLAKLTPQQQLYRDPPYRINNANGQLLGHNTIGTTATHADGSLEYNAHNLYGLSEAVATHSALEKITGKRPFILTRSSFLGTGAVSAHWTGDNAATWADLRWSITTTLGMGLVGVPFVGADICGFSGDTTEELCARWISAGAFYPFARDHNTLGAAPQELYEWESVADAGRRAIKMRYQLLPHLYTAFHQANKQGTPVARPLWFAYPQDPATHAIDDQWLFGDVLVTPILDEGQTKREGYFPKGKWYNLFDNTTIDAHEGKSVTLDLPMGHVGVHMPGGTILPLQQAALVTADVRTSALTLLVALPHLEPLPALAATSETPSYNQQTGLRADSSMSQQSNAEEVSKQAQLTLPGTGRKLLTKSDSQAVMRQGRDVEGPSPGQKCGVSEAGRMTACGHIYMDDGHQLQVGQAGDNVADMYAEVVQDAVSGSWHGRLHVSFQQTDAGNNDCGSMSWPHIGSVVVKGVPLHARVMVDRQQDQLVVNGLQHEMQCGQAFAMTWTLTDNTALV
ncbi:TPA: hypothetical protein ACH3X3_010764 [Trebouxia sp. C0006]